MPPDFDLLFDRPIIVLAAPRSGSTLLFETISEARGIWTVGGESHQFIEGLWGLDPMSGKVDSNRLVADNADDWTAGWLRKHFAVYLRDREGRTLVGDQHNQRVRLLEKTPKNALRQPVLEKIFPGALYIFLYNETEILSVLDRVRDVQARCEKIIDQTAA